MAELLTQRPRLRTHAGLLLLAGLVLLAVLAGRPATAGAYIGYVYDPVESAAIPPEPKSVSALGVDSTSGYIYVTSYGDPRVKRFSAAGAPVAFPATGTNALQGTGEVGSPSEGDFGGITDIEVDSAGSIYLADGNRGVTLKFDVNGNFIRHIGAFSAPNTGTVPKTEPGSFQPRSLAIGPDGLYVADPYNGLIDIFNPVSGAYIRQITVMENSEQLGFAEAVDVDSKGRVYVSGGFWKAVFRFGPNGECGFWCDPPLENDFINVGNAVDAGTGEVFALAGGFSSVPLVNRFDENGNLLEEFGRGLIAGNYGAIAVNESNGKVYLGDFESAQNIKVFDRVILPDIVTGAVIDDTPKSVTVHGTVGPGGGPDVATCKVEYGTDTSYSSGSVPCAPAAPYNADTPITASLTNLDPESTYRFRIVATNANGPRFGPDKQFTTLPAVASVTTGAASDVLAETATVSGSLDPKGVGTAFYFEYGLDTNYGQKAPVPSGDAGSGNGGTPVSTGLANLLPGQIYHYRLAATNVYGTTVGGDKTFELDSAPTIDSYTATDLSATTAILRAEINPHGDDTRYHFEYGPTEAYGTTVPIPDGTIPSANTKIPVEAPIVDLQIGIPYHFRVVASNVYGTTVSEDRTFSFFTPNCPNAHVRQETTSNTLPDCRAYELVSPPNAGSTVFFPSGPWSGRADNPARIAYTGVLGSIPGSPPPINVLGDLYVSTRTDTGWTSKYIGLPSGIVNQMGGSPVEGYCSYIGQVSKFQNGVLTNTEMSSFVNWDSGNALAAICKTLGGEINDQGEGALWSKSPYIWNSEGRLIDRWPTNRASVPGESTPHLNTNFQGQYGHHRGYRGATAASPDLSHYFFSSREVAFAPNGLVKPPGSAYDNDITNRTVTIISKQPDGSDIQQEPEQPGWEEMPWTCDGPGQPNAAGLTHIRDCEYIRFAGVSRDGSVDIGSSSENGNRVLMTTRASAMCVPVNSDNYCPPEYSEPVRLWMRENQAVTYEVSKGHLVRYLEMTPDARHVYFMSAEKLATTDTDANVDIYRWDQPTNELTQVSLGNNGKGNTANCNASWVSGCSTETASTVQLNVQKLYELVGNQESDNMIADNGDIYFYSPELLDGGNGVEGKRNLYYFDMSAEEVRFVATLEADKPLERIQVSPENDHAAFVTRSGLTNYDNADHLMMYAYDVVQDEITCVSCLPSGAAPTADIRGSANGLFMADDGRTFFATTDGLVPQDTNALNDVYEYVDGRPQLLTTGTGSLDKLETHFEFLGAFSILPGLIGVSADGVNAYFTSFESLVREDRNGVQIKVYNARTNGGFPFEPPPPPCAAADECHGAGAPLLGETRDRHRRLARRHRQRQGREGGKEEEGEGEGEEKEEGEEEACRSPGSPFGRRQARWLS